MDPPFAAGADVPCNGRRVTGALTLGGECVGRTFLRARPVQTRRRKPNEKRRFP